MREEKEIPRADVEFFGQLIGMLVENQHHAHDGQEEQEVMKEALLLEIRMLMCDDEYARDALDPMVNEPLHVSISCFPGSNVFISAARGVSSWMIYGPIPIMSTFIS